MRRAVDILISLFAGIIVSPVVAVVGVLIRRRLGPPAIFRQRRSGLDGREFTIVKFRTMRAPDYDGEPDAARDTPLGQRLRSMSLDELPQIWNVLVGDMSLIGPRPTLPEQVRHYSARQRGRLSIRPGITGWAQVNGRNSLTWPERIELDLWYIENRSLKLDATIVLRTIRQLVRPTGILGAGGVNPGFPLPSDPDRPAGESTQDAAS